LLALRAGRRYVIPSTGSVEMELRFFVFLSLAAPIRPSILHWHQRRRHELDQNQQPQGMSDTGTAAEAGDCGGNDGKYRRHGRVP
jgi:hypothetical protein